MYKLLGIFLILASIVFGGYSWWQSAIEAATTIKAPTNQGLVGYWSFEEATGTKATDFSGNGNTGTLTDLANPATATSGWGSGRLGGGLNFDGVNDYVDVGDPSSGVLDFSGAFTISHWINPGDSIDAFSINKRSSGLVIGYDFLIGPVSTAGQAQFRLQDSITGGGNSNTATGLNDGKWHHLVGVFTGTQILLYKDGSAVGNPVSYTPAGNFLNTTAFNIAARTGASFYTGKIDEVRIYNRALSVTEITKLYQSGAAKINASQNGYSTDGLVGEWSFDGTDVSDKVYDRSGQNNNGYFIGGATSSAKVVGKVGQALSFSDTNNQYVDIINETNFDFERTQPFSYSIWVKPTKGNTNIALLLSKQSNSSPFNGWSFVSNYDESSNTNVPGRLAVELVNNNTNNRIGIEAASVINDGQWHYYVVTYDGSSSANGVKIYEDGTSLALTVAFNTLSASILNNVNVEIGDRDGGGSSMNYSGSIDEVRIYNRALSATEITKLYQSGAAKINASQNGDLTNGLVRIWSFNGPDASDKIYDRSGQGDNGYFNGRATSSAKVMGKVGQAFSFLGTDTVNTTVTSDTNFTGAITLSVWAKTTSGITYLSFISKVVTNGATNNPFDFRTDSATPPKLALVRANTAHREWLGPNTVPGSWHHYVVTSNTSNINVAPIFYVDGVATTGTVGTGTGTGNATGSGVVAKIGRRADGFVQMIGSMDEVRIYNRALSAGEVAQLYNMGR